MAPAESLAKASSESAPAGPGLPGRFGLSDWRAALLTLLVLANLVPAQSIYEILAGNLEFLEVRQIDRVRLVEIVSAFSVLLPLALFVVWATCARLRRSLGRYYLATVVGFFSLLFFWQVHNDYLVSWQPPLGFGYVWILPAIAVAAASVKREEEARAFFLLLSPVVLLFPALFLARTWNHATEGLSVAADSAPAAIEKKRPPVFLLVFDELALRALLDESGQINRERFPHLATLADESHWFRNATVNGAYTTRSIPILLTGSFPSAPWPRSSRVGESLFTMLQPEYEIYIHELYMNFCKPLLPRFHCLGTDREPTRGLIFKDILLMYSARVSPEGVPIRRPNLKGQWGPFREALQEIAARRERFQHFLNTIPAPPADNSLVYFYHMLPHAPYALTRAGEAYDHHVRQGIIWEDLQGDNLSLAILRERYLLQIEYIDEEVGQFVARLKQLGLYDPALVIFTSDHGVSWKPEAPGRKLTHSNADMILFVPLFIKLPYQKGGVVSDENVQLIDLVPTVADVVGLPVPWPVEGRNIFENGGQDRKRIVLSSGNSRFEFPADLDLSMDEALPVEPPAAPSRPWVGRNLTAFEIAPAGSANGDMLPLFIPLQFSCRPPAACPVYVSGWVEKSALPVELVVALNDNVAAVLSLSEWKLDWDVALWHANIPREMLQEGENRVRVFTVEDARQNRLAVFGSEKGYRLSWTEQRVHGTVRAVSPSAAGGTPR